MAASSASLPRRERTLRERSRQVEEENHRLCEQNGIRCLRAPGRKRRHRGGRESAERLGPLLTVEQLKRISETRSKEVDSWQNLETTSPTRRSTSSVRERTRGPRLLHRGDRRGGRVEPDDYSASEDDNVTVQGVLRGQRQTGIGLSYLLENEGELKAVQVDGDDGCVRADRRDRSEQQYQAAFTAALA